MTSRCFVFRVDAAAHIGTGHLMRCLTLADRLADQGYDCHFLCRDHAPAADTLAAIRHTLHRIVPKAAPGENLDQEHAPPAHAHWLDGSQTADAAACIHLLNRLERVDWVIVDHYALDQVWERQIGAHCDAVLVIDDLVDRPHCNALLVDQNLGRKPDAYANLVSAATHCLTGARYALLRPEFANARPAALTRRQGVARPEHLLINLGGVDAGNYTPDLLRMAQGLWPGRITVVLGHTAPGQATVQAMADAYANITLVVGSNDMAGLLSDADVAIAAAGTSAWERCTLGLPTLMVQCADNQREVARPLHACGAALDLGAVAQLGRAQLSRALDSIREPARYRAMCDSAAGICDGLGALRVRMAMQAPAFAHGAASTGILRTASVSDIEYLYYLQTLPGVRQWAGDPRIPRWEAHVEWSRHRLQSDPDAIHIVYDGAAAAGMLRLDHIAPGDVEISIIIDPAHAGRGLATAAIHEALEKRSTERLLARIHPDNSASRKLFAKAGFTYRDDRDGFQRWFA